MYSLFYKLFTIKKHNKQELEMIIEENKICNGHTNKL